MAQTAENGSVLSEEDHWARARAHYRIWHGHWSRYSCAAAAGDDDVEAYRMLRHFEQSENGRKVRHQNTLSKPDGPVVRGPWDFSIEDSLRDGIRHPAAPENRSLHLTSGWGAFWAPLKATLPSEGGFLQFELYLIHPDNRDVRASALFGYKGGEAFCVILNREDARPNTDEFPIEQSFWSEGAALDAQRSPLPKGRLRGHVSSLTSSLQISKSAEKETWSDYASLLSSSTEQSDHRKILHLPDGITVTMPEVLEAGKAIGFSMTWVLSQDSVLQVVGRLDESGCLGGVEGAHYKTDSESN